MCTASLFLRIRLVGGIKVKRLIILFLLLLCACAKEIKLEQFESNQWMAEIKGEVNCPGVYPIQADTNLSDLIAMAEGVK